MNINNLIISGWVQSDPEEVVTRGGKRNVRFRAMNYKKYLKADGSWGENKIFFDVVAWGNVLVDRILDTIHKNIEVVVEGSLAINTFVDQEGRKKSRTECIARSVEVIESGSMPDLYKPAAQNPQAPRVEKDDFGNDDIPF